MAIGGPAIADACALIAFFAAGGATMSPAGLAAMQGEVTISPITVWELTRKAAIGKLPPLPEAQGSFARWLSAQGFTVQPFGWAEAERANALPPLHRDPMDRMLAAQALLADRPVITSDATFAAYGVRMIW